ncbi:MAG: glycosidase [Rhodomicrobium sp.]
MSIVELESTAREFAVKRLGVIMEPEQGNALEVEGVLNPAAARGRDGQLYLFPRLVAQGNYSRIGIARVIFNAAGDPAGVERLGIALEPEADYELHAGGGGCEDPRITFFEPLDLYVMTYTAFSQQGPRIAMAVSRDLFQWRRAGLVSFCPFGNVAFDGVDDKDASLFPVQIPDSAGHLSIAIIHRPLFPGTRPEETANLSPHRGVDLDRESIWISYCPSNIGDGKKLLCRFTQHHRLVSPVEAWENLKIGCGTPPVLTRHGWLLIYHGVHNMSEPGADFGVLSYSAGVMVLSARQPEFILYRGAYPLLAPTSPGERRGIVNNVVFPTAIDRRDDLGQPERLDLYYGMGDYRIGVARLTVPEKLHLRSIADPQQESKSGLYVEAPPNPGIILSKN